MGAIAGARNRALAMRGGEGAAASGTELVFCEFGVFI